jgi:MFS family permease
MNQFKSDIAEKNESFSNKSLTHIYSWLVWILCAVFFFYKYMLQVSPSVMSTELMSAFSISGAGLGNLAACFFYAYLIMQIPVGLLLDRYSPHLITTFAIFVCSLGALGFAHAYSLWQAEISRAMIGFGAAFAAISCFKMATIWFPPRRFALVAGLSMTAAMLGAVGGEAPLSLLVNAHGWRGAMNDIALPGFLLMLLVLSIVRDKKPGTSHIKKRAKVNLSQLWLQIKIILKHKQTWLLSIYSGLAFAPVSVFGGLWGVSFFKVAYHLTATQAASAISFIFIGFAIGCPIAGWYSDYIRRRKIIMALGTTTALITMLCALYLPYASLKTLEILMLIFGLGASCFFLCFSMVREIHVLVFAATVLGFMNVFDSILEALSEPFIGKLLDLGWNGTFDHGTRVFSLHNYHLALASIPVYFILALLVLFYITETYCKQKE